MNQSYLKQNTNLQESRVSWINSIRPVKTNLALMKKYLFSSIIIFLFTFTQFQFIKAQVAVQDSLALVDLYNSTNGPGWTSKANWLTGPVKNWYGITVTANRVVNINLGYNQLTGS